jgi:hypothetical protein
MRESWTKLIFKYFVHGFFFTFLITLLIIGLFFVAAVLMLLGGILGLIALAIGIMVLFGVANNLINRAVWGDSMNWSIPALLIHGLGLFVAILIINCVIVLLPQLLFPGLITTLVTFIPACILDGRVCRSIAERWID